jgi:hypothetical protein
LNPTFASLCAQPQSLSVSSNSLGVIAQGNIWQININKIYGSPVLVNSLEILTQEQPVSETVVLMLFDANQQLLGQYVSQMNTGSSLFQNLPSTPISALLLQFLGSTISTDYLINIVLCPPPSVLSSESILLFF